MTPGHCGPGYVPATAATVCGSGAPVFPGEEAAGYFAEAALFSDLFVHGDVDTFWNAGIGM